MQPLVACGHPNTTAAAVHLLKNGGNAFDAIIAAGFASSITQPVLTSLGGGGFLLAKTRDDRVEVFDFFTNIPGVGNSREIKKPHTFPVTVRFPGKDQIFHTGPGSVAVPGNLKGFVQVHRELGQRPLREIVAPAIHYAREGVVINSSQAYLFQLVHPCLTNTSEGKALYGRTPLLAGERFRNPDYADYLETLPVTEGEDFYSGGRGRQMVQLQTETNGYLTREDLAHYRVVERRPLSQKFRDHTILTNPAPSIGGVSITTSLEIFEKQPKRAKKWMSPDHILPLCRAMKRAEIERHKRPAATRGTTHFCVSDADGNVASMTTSNGEGSGVIVPGTGIMLNNMLGEEDLFPDGIIGIAPGKRMPSMMAPSFAMREGQLRLTLGSGGSNRIRTVIYQLIAHFVDFDLGLRELIDQPRLHWDAKCLQIEPGFSAEVLAALKAEFPVNVWTKNDLYFGGVQAIRPGREAKGDRRRGGCAAAVR